MSDFPESYKYWFEHRVFDGESMIDREKARERGLRYYYGHIEKCREASRRYNAEHREERKKWRQEHRERELEKAKERRDRIRREVLTHYSNGALKCTHCGFGDERALTIDHINGGECKHRKRISAESSDSFYAWLVKNGFPEGYQVLCYNCNCVKGRR